LQHPGVVRLLRFILGEARALDIPAAVCGEAAGDPRYTRLLLALGLTEFSMHPARLLEVKQVIRETHVATVRAAVEHWLEDPSGLQDTSLLQFLDHRQASI
jgi:phosphotransferase system enzyme I (PtsI)